MATWLFPFLMFGLGAAVGSFLNVVVYRLPAGLSLLHPPSHCPRCQHPLAAYDNVPVLGWLWLRGRCRYCGTAIAPRYPLVEALTGGLFLATFLRFGLTGATPAFWILISWLIALAFIDLDTLTLPNVLTESGLVLGLLSQGLLGVTTPPAIAHNLLGGILGAVLGIWIFDAIGLLGALALGQQAMGGGDGKLAAMLGAWLGWSGMLLSGFLACVLGAAIGGGAIALGLLSRRDPIPFGPFLVLGALITLFWGDTLVNFYLRLFFPTVF